MVEKKLPKQQLKKKVKPSSPSPPKREKGRRGRTAGNGKEKQSESLALRGGRKKHSRKQRERKPEEVLQKPPSPPRTRAVRRKLHMRREGESQEKEENPTVLQKAAGIYKLYE